MAELLIDYLRASCGRAFAWGRDDDRAVDCYWWAAGWIARLRGEASIAPLRAKYFGRYSDAAGAVRLIRSVGGYRAAFRELAETAGCRQIDQASRGDLVAVRQRRELSLGICVGVRTVLRAPQGVIAFPVSPVLAWRVI